MNEAEKKQIAWEYVQSYMVTHYPAYSINMPSAAEMRRAVREALAALSIDLTLADAEMQDDDPR